MKPIYILASSTIHPQPLDFPKSWRPLQAGGMMCMEPDYSTLIPPMQLRRMSRVLRMGVYTGIDCLQKGGIIRPDGIITGTGKGSMSDTEKFVKDLVTYQEAALNPTPFILSTYNAINGALALQEKTTGYNQTFVHRGSSLEWGILDAQMALQEEGINNLLVGSFEELTDEYIFIKNKIGYWKKEWDNEKPIWEQAETPGTIGGEGTSFFLISKEQADSTLAIHSVVSATQPENSLQFIQENLSTQNWNWSDIDLLIMGNNGDQSDEIHYKALENQLPEHIPILNFKNLCGEYETAGGFALWLLHQWTLGSVLPDSVWKRKGMMPKQPAKILLYNHYRNHNHNLLLLESIKSSI